MENVDKVIKTIYLASSGVREEMMASLVENILYAWGEPLDLQDICSTINEEFTIQPSSNEVRDSLHHLRQKGLVTETGSGYTLTAAAKIDVDQKVRQNDAAEKARYENFELVLTKIHAVDLTKQQQERLWQVYNNYVNECFLQYQRDAVKMLMPYSIEEENGTDLVKKYVGTLDDPACKTIFPILVTTYPNHLSQADLNYINLIAERAERFYSLGLPEADYQAATDFKVSNWVLIADTNVLYSVLKLRDHAENEACQELTQLAKTGLIGFRIAYLPFTLIELKTKQYDLAGRVVSTNLTANQIDVLRQSGKLDPFMQPYYDQMAATGKAVSPAERIEKAQYILENEKIKIYNPKQIYDLEENGQHMSQAYGEFYDFERLRNEARISKGLGERTGKSELQTEHDIMLREVILALRDGKTSLADIKQIGLTLDDALLRFDRYMIDRKRLPTNTAPTFFLPSLLLRRLRGFIPLNTTDYRKAFFRAVSTKTFDPENKPLSVLVQRSVAYFNALGIDNPQIMMQMLSDEIFLTGLEEADKKGQGEEFTRSELDKRFGAMEKSLESLESKVNTIVADRDQQSADFQRREEQLAADAEKIRREGQAKLDEQTEATRLIELRHQELMAEEQQRHTQQQQEYQRQQQMEAKKTLLIALEPPLKSLDLQNAKLSFRAKFQLASVAFVLGLVCSGSIFYYKKELIAIKEYVDPILFALALPFALFGIAYWLLRGSEFSKDQEVVRGNLLSWYRKWLNKRNGFNAEEHKAIGQQVEQLRAEINAPDEPKLLTTQP